MIRIMERVVGEIFDFNGVKLEVKDKGNCCLCNGCYFYSFTGPCAGTHYKKQTGECFRLRRTDHKYVIFVEVNNDQVKED